MMLERRVQKTAWFVLSGIGLLLVSCGGQPGGAARTVRPDQLNAKSALGETACTNPGDEIEPWVIDLPGDQRGTLKRAMDKGIVVVSYDCKQLKILRGCKVDGNYEYSSTGFNEDAFRLEDADSVKATLSGGAALAAKLDADMKRGTKLDVAYAIVGESNTTVPALTRGQLKGAECKGATHFVATASLGAFAMRSSTDAQVSAAAEVFGQAASGASSSSSAHMSSSGKRMTCQKISSSDATPVVDCDIPLKLRLVPVAEERVASSHSSGMRSTAGCAGNTVRSGFMCVSASRATTKTCKQGDAKSCEEQCKKGDGSSCSILGYMFEKAKGVAEDSKRALEFYELGCSKKDIAGCTGLGFLYSKGEGVAQDKAKASNLFKEACEKGNGRACSGIGHQLRLTNDIAGAIPWMDKGCSLGYVRACFYAGTLLTKTNKDPQRAYKAHERACLGEDLRGCLAQSSLQASGTGTAANTSESIALRDRATAALDKKCNDKDAESCEALGDYHMGLYDKAAKHPENALKYYGAACAAGVDGVCIDFAKILERGDPPIPKNPQSAKQLYEVACMRSAIPEACAKVGRKPGAPPAPTLTTKKKRR